MKKSEVPDVEAAPMLAVRSPAVHRAVFSLRGRGMTRDDWMERLLLVPLALLFLALIFGWLP